MLWLLGSGHLRLLPVRVLGCELGRWAHAELGVKPLTPLPPGCHRRPGSPMAPGYPGSERFCSATSSGSDNRKPGGLGSCDDALTVRDHALEVRAELTSGGQVDGVEGARLGGSGPWIRRARLTRPAPAPGYRWNP
jgi:hypothetical protein